MSGKAINNRPNIKHIRSNKLNTESNVSERYAEGAKAVEPSLCCPVEYDAGLLELLPREIIDKDYGCGDPSRYVENGDTVLDLGSGGGKICYMAAQLVGEHGQVIGVDMTDEMLALARKYQAEMAQKLGGDKVSFRKGYIQDLALNLEARDAFLQENPGIEERDPAALSAWENQQKQSAPLVANDSVDIVVSNCVLNLVDEKHRSQMISEIFRVLKPGGRVAISDIVSDEFVPQHLKDDERLWSGCISGAFQEQQFIQVFLDAGFIDVAYDKWDEAPWQVVEGIEFRSVTVMATRPEVDNVDKGHTVIYRGPFAELKDDRGRVYRRGIRMAVDESSFEALADGMAKDSFIFIEPDASVTADKELEENGQRSPEESKGTSHITGGRKKSGCC
ncbi:MAG: arsenite methyltransferase [Pseudohongiellaceae bacterium]|jgi:arsenite methyltransferase